MTNEERNTALYQKMFAEQENYRKWLLTQPPEEILNHAYEHVVREDILLSLEYNNLTNAQASALMKSAHPLKDVFDEFESRQTGYMDEVFHSMESRANAVIAAEQRRILKETPVYLYPADYARKNGELEQYRASRKANIACKQAIEAAIREHYHDNRLGKEAASEVIDVFGMDRTIYVLAVTVRYMDWDGRISRSNKDWARTIPVFENPDAWGDDRNNDFVVSSHPGLTNLFLDQVRREQDLWEEEFDKKYSALIKQAIEQQEKIDKAKSALLDRILTQLHNERDTNP